MRSLIGLCQGQAPFLKIETKNTFHISINIIHIINITTFTICWKNDKL